jgi:hypothetical protein
MIVEPHWKVSWLSHSWCFTRLQYIMKAFAITESDTRFVPSFHIHWTGSSKNSLTNTKQEYSTYTCIITVMLVKMHADRHVVISHGHFNISSNSSIRTNWLKGRYHVQHILAAMAHSNKASSQALYRPHDYKRTVLSKGTLHASVYAVIRSLCLGSKPCSNASIRY